MTKKIEPEGPAKPAKPERNWTGPSLKTGAVIAGAAIGSAAIAAALLYVSRRKDKPTAPPPHPEDAPETD